MIKVDFCVIHPDGITHQDITVVPTKTDPYDTSKFPQILSCKVKAGPTSASVRLNLVINGMDPHQNQTTGDVDISQITNQEETLINFNNGPSEVAFIRKNSSLRITFTPDDQT